ncbi:MAG: DUF192 domain-containing protein [Candidatus Altiarchaeales archaeon]|nr:DUF192 domain-containing protein [Candidatus Altiarchaeales archaeon]
MKKFLALLVLVSACLSPSQTSRVCFSDDCFRLEVADDDAQRRRGLMYRDTLDMDSGMLFIFPRPAKYSFWMKNTQIPLDIIWLDENKSVVYIQQNTPPCDQTPCLSYAPPEDALYVLEVNAGLTSEKNISPGDDAVFLS